MSKVKTLTDEYILSLPILIRSNLGWLAESDLKEVLEDYVKVRKSKESKDE